MEYVYSTNRNKIFAESFTIWLYLLLLLASDVIFILKKQFTPLIIISLLLSTLIIPALYIFIRYYKYSIGKKIIVNDTYIGLVDKRTNALHKLRLDEIKEIIVTQPSPFFNRAPWNDYGYISIVGYNNLEIIVTSFTVNPDIFILNCIEGRIRKDQIIKKKKNYPII